MSTRPRESTARQYALADRAVALGWPRSQVQLIDDDLGKSGQSIEGRPGFQRLLAEVALDRVGLILGLEMSRLARSCKDWHHLLELCARFRVLLADADGVYDPTEYSDRLLLGLTGMMNEAELHILKQRMYQGKLNKARRGELVVGVPSGDVKSPAGQVTFDPDEQVQGVIRLIFDQFDRQGTVHGVLRSLIAGGIRLPVRRQAGADRGQLDWRPPCRETVRHILRHPMYAGAYRYGFRPTDARRQTPGRPRSGRGSGLAAEDCLVFLRDRFPAYITWERFEANQARLAANRSRAESAGAVRGGAALLAGVVWCGRCGKRMYVRYGRTGRRPSYVCSTLRSDYGLPLCQSASAAEVEAWVAGQVLEALKPAVLDASLDAAAEVEAATRMGPDTGSSGSSGRGTTPTGPPGSTTRASRRTGWWPGPWSGSGTRRCGRSSNWRRNSTGSSGRSRGPWAKPTASRSAGWPERSRRCGRPRRRRPRIAARSSGCWSTGWC